MAGPATILRELHRLRRHAADLQAQIDRGPQTLKARQTRITRQDETLKEAQDAIKRLKVTIHEKEVTLKSVLGQIKKHEKQLDEAGGKKEYDALRTEIANARKEMQRLEDEIIADMMDTEERTARLPEVEKELQKVKDESAQFERDYQSRLAGFQEQFQQTLQAIKDGEATLSDEARPLYNRLINARGADGLAPVVERTCSACYTGITPQNYNELLMELFVICKSCGRILYLPE